MSSSATITLNTAQQLYVLHHGHGYTCLGFANARDHASQIAERLKRPDLAFGTGDFGSLSGYGKYQAAVQAWGASPLSRRTYFDPGTDPRAARILERCRSDDAKVRLILGSTVTGEAWLDQHDVVGRIGRSTGILKVPLLIEPGADGGSAILTACLLAIVAWDSGTFLYRHCAYRTPELSIQRHDDPQRPWAVLHCGAITACFPDIGKAGAYVAFMCGETIEPRIFR